jgi:hypothetical protein
LSGVVRNKIFSGDYMTNKDAYDIILNSIPFPHSIEVTEALILVEKNFISYNSAMLKLPKVEEIISEVIGSRSSMHDIAVTAGINECYRIIVRQLQQ